MADRIYIPLPDGRWLALERQAFEVAVNAGAELAAPTTPPMAPAGSRRLLTSEQLGSQLNIPPTWLEEAARRDELPCVRVGKYLRFDLDEVLTCLNPRIVGANVRRKTRQKG